MAKPKVSLKEHFTNLKHDVPAGVVVFLVALPLCLGIAHASGVPPLAGVVSGIVGGIVVALASGSHTAVSGPAAGLIVIVLAAAESLGYAGLLLATFLAGALQLLFGVLRFGGIAKLFPPAVVRAMLVAIGIILILKQIPHAVGFSGDFEGDLAFMQEDGRNTFTEIPFALGHFHIGAVLIALIGIALVLVERKVEWIKKIQWIPGPLLAVVAGVGLNEMFHAWAPSLAVGQSLLVQMPVGGIDAVNRELMSPDFAMIGNTEVWTTAVTLALIASIETLLCVEALDSIDPMRRETPPNRELFAQGAGNMVAPLFGGIPLTAVIIRGTANVSSGGRTRMSSFIHGWFLLAAVLVAAPLMNRIPLAALAAILLHVGFKLAHPVIFRDMFRRSKSHWVPFLATIGIVLFTDLLIGVMAGFGIAILFIVFDAIRARRAARSRRSRVRIRLAPTVPWISKLALRRSLAHVDDGASVVIDARDTDLVHPDVREEIEKFVETAKARSIRVRLLDLPGPDAAASH